MTDTVLEIIAQGAWNGGNLVDNSIYENKGMTFKGGIPVNNQTIEERIGVRTRVVAPEDERIGVLAFQDLLQTSDIDPSRIKLIIGATNIGLDQLLSGNSLTLDTIDLLIEHQANFTMIPLTLEQVLNSGQADLKNAAADFIAQKMVTNIHVRGNCSVVCMQRLPYDLERGELRPDKIQGYPVNQNLENLRNAKTILYDSIGAGMTRSSFLLRKKYG